MAVGGPLLWVLAGPFALAGEQTPPERPAVPATRDVGVAAAPVVGGIRLYGNSWAVVIGINQYRNPGIKPLGAGVNDAQRMREALIRLGFPERQVFTLTDEQATKAAIENLLGDRLRRLAKGEDRILVFFAGHGTTEKGRGGLEEGYLLPVDADPENLFATAISMTTLKQIAARQMAKHVLFAVDACYSGYAIYPTRGITNPALVEELTRKSAVQVITAGRAGDLAQERGDQGLFTRVLIAGLEGQADQRGWGWVSLHQLGAYVQARVFSESDRRQLPQYGNLEGEGQFVFVLPGRAEEVRGGGGAGGEQTPAIALLPPPAPVMPTPSLSTGDLDLTSDPAGATVRLDGRDVGTTPLTLERVPVGEHLLELDKDGIYATRKTITIAAHTLERHSVKLERRKGKLTVFSEPRDARVLLDGRDLGRTPVSLEVEAGPYTLKLTKEGYKPHEEPLSLPADKETRTRIALRSTQGTLDVTSTPPGATVEIGGTPRGQTPLTLALEEGTYPLRLRLPRHRTATRQAEIAGERITRVSVDLVHLPSQKTGELQHRGTDQTEMAFIPEGTFTMGDTKGDGFKDEQPAHSVFVEAFWLDRTEVTNAQFARFVQNSSYRSQGLWQKEATGKDTHPVVNVTWHDAVAYCRWADKRLPTEAEWEYAGRGTDNRTYPWGSTWQTDKARFDGNRGFFVKETTAPVGSYPSGASPFGILDLAGNVWEWTSTLYTPYPYSATDGREELTALGLRVNRGGSWGSSPRNLRSTDRGSGDLTYRGDYLGFRCAQDVRE
jgi:iron(II)-dependent oxidoreductase